jgi:hypothetical protein
MTTPEKHGMKLIGIKDRKAIYASETLLAQKGEFEVRKQLGLLRYYPVCTNLSGTVIMVRADSQAEAIARYLRSAGKP